MQRVYRYLSLRPHHFQPRRNSAFSGVYVNAGEPEATRPLELDGVQQVQQVQQASTPRARQCARAPSVVVLDASSAPRARRAGALALLCCRPGPLRPRLRPRLRPSPRRAGAGPEGPEPVE